MAKKINEMCISYKNILKYLWNTSCLQDDEIDLEWKYEKDFGLQIREAKRKKSNFDHGHLKGKMNQYYGND